MTSVRPGMVYDDRKTYPMVINHRIVEVDGRTIKGWIRAVPKSLTEWEYDELINRIVTLETELKALKDSHGLG